jgi:hypothetical protein
MVTKANAVENWCCAAFFFKEFEAQNNLDEAPHYDTDSDDDESNL